MALTISPVASVPVSLGAGRLGKRTPPDSVARAGVGGCFFLVDLPADAGIPGDQTVSLQHPDRPLHCLTRHGPLVRDQPDAEQRPAGQPAVLDPRGQVRVYTDVSPGVFGWHESTLTVGHQRPSRRVNDP